MAILGPALTGTVGRGGAAIIEGEPGIGKTRLAMELRGGASDAGFLGGERHLLRERLVAALRTLVAGRRGDRTRGTGGAARYSPARPAGGDARPSGRRYGGPASDPLAEEGRFRAVDAVARLVLDVAASEPLLVVLDDLQWADAASLEVLAYLARFLPGAPLLVLGTYRTGDVGLEHLLARSLGELDRHGVSVRVPLGPLSDGDALVLVECLGGTLPPHLSANIVREANGHPFFITEVVRHLLDNDRDLSTPIELGVPPSVRDAVAMRLARIGARDPPGAGVAAAFTRPFEFSVLAAMADLGEEELLTALDEARRSQMLRSVAHERYEFSHALIRKALYDDVGPSRRARLHRRIAQALEQVYAGHELDQAGELAAQYHASVSLPGAAHGVRYAVAVADEARAAHAHDQAVAALRMACDLAADAAVSIRCDVTCRRAVAEAEALLVEDAVHSADDALDLLEEANADPELVADFVVGVARPLQEATMVAWQHMAGGAREAVVARLVERGLSALGDQHGLRWARLRLLERPKARDDAGPVHSGCWRGFDPEAVAIARASGDEEDYASTIVAQDPRSRFDTRELLERVDGWVTPRAKIRGLSEVLVTLLLQHGALREAVDVASRFQAYSEEVGSLLGQLEAVSGRAAALERLGEFDAAVADAAAVRRATRPPDLRRSLGPAPHAEQRNPNQALAGGRLGGLRAVLPRLCARFPRIAVA